MECPTAIVIGAGAGGVAVAARLAKRGFRVTVVEKNEFFEEIFIDLSTSLDAEEVRLIKCDPNYRIWFPDQQTIDFSSDIVQIKRVIEQHDGRQGFERFLELLVESGRRYRLSSIHVLGKDFSSLWSMLRPSLIRSLWKLHLFESMYHRVSRYFRSEKLRQAFTFASMYLGMNPFEAPGTYSLLQYTECTDGIWYPAGGFQTVLRALADIGTRFGVQYRLNCPVASLVLSDDQEAVCGVALESGEKLDANLVIVNVDLVYSYSKFLPKSTYVDHLKTKKILDLTPFFLIKYQMIMSVL